MPKLCLQSREHALVASYTHVVQSETEEEQRMSDVLEGLLQKRASLAAELGALERVLPLTVVR